MKKLLFILLTLSLLPTYSQSDTKIDSLYKPDKYYLEDQLYFGISYIILKNLPDGIAQNGFSNSIKFGFIRDIPINEKRNLGFGIGLGYSRDVYYHNLRVSVDESTGNLQYQILDAGDFKTNSFTIHKIDLPFEIRIRGSRSNKFKFWRVYSGIITSYDFSAESQFTTSNVNVTYKNLKIINPIKFGLNISAGYGLWNFNFYYGLSNIMKKGLKYNDLDIKMNDMHFGVIYYFL